MWQYTGTERPPFADPPGPGQESVWDYPRPPKVVGDSRLVTVHAGERRLAETRAAVRVLETASPPTFYLPADDVDTAGLAALAQTSWCEWKGRAVYFALDSDPGGLAVAWCYPEPAAAFRSLAGRYGFYPGRVICRVDGETVRPQAGGFYGGWVTNEIAGPCKGAPDTGHW